MNVALTFPGCHRRGGVERIVFECARHLSGRGHDVSVFANEWERSESHPIRFQHVPMRSRPSFLSAPSFFRESTRQLRDSKFDVLNTHGCICPTGGVHWVQSVHKAWLECSRTIRTPLSAAWWKQRCNPLHPALLRLEQLHFVGRRYRRLIATSEGVREDLHRLYDVPREDVEIIPNGFAPDEFNPETRRRRREAMRRQLGLHPDQVVLLFVGNELERKGYRTILSALRVLNDPRVVLLVVGRCDVRRVQKLASGAGVADRVIPGGLTSDVAGFHAAADLLVLPTQYEAFCLAILEALGSGLPVVTSDVPGARDAVVAGVNGAIIRNPRDGEELACVLRPLLDGDRRALLSAAAPGSVRQYQWPNVLAQFEQVLLDHCEPRSGSPLEHAAAHSR
jgi:UDP-glucose:(heptosyl)LPS alpha-1,3-glucosyltransferase